MARGGCACDVRTSVPDKPELAVAQADQATSAVVRAADVHQDDANAPADRANIVSMIEDLEGQVDTAFKLKRAVEAELEATQKELSEELAVRAEFEARVKSLELRAPLADRSRENSDFAKQERDKMADSLAETRQQLEAITSERDSLVEELDSAQARAGGLERERTAREAQAMNRTDKVEGPDRLRAELAEATAACRASREQIRGLSSRLDAAEASKSALEGDLAEPRAAEREQAEELRQTRARADNEVTRPRPVNTDRRDSRGQSSPEDEPVISTALPGPELVQTTRLEDSRGGAVLDRLDAGGQDSTKNRRAAERHYYQIEHCVVHLRQPGAGSSAAYVVAARNISAGGLSFLHVALVPEGSKCLVQLITTDEACQTVSGVVTRSRPAEQDLYEVGIRFDAAIVPEDFLYEPGHKNAVGGFLSYGAFGFTPLPGYLLACFGAQLQPHTFVAACVLGGLTLFALGALRARVTGRNWLMSGLGMLVVGGIIAVAAYGIGRGLAGLA